MRRPQTSHKKGSSFRRDRLTNESANNIEDFTPNTGNLELESLQHVNNDSFEIDFGGDIAKNPRSKKDQVRPPSFRQKHFLKEPQDLESPPKREDMIKNKSSQFIERNESSGRNSSDGDSEKVKNMINRLIS